MISKTPQFDKALDAILDNVAPHESKCACCGGPFDIFSEDIRMYRLLRVPPPKLCPLCRKKRRFGHYMRLPRFYRRKCDVPGHSENVITVFPPSAPGIVYDFSYWFSDQWDATSFSRDYDASKSFFQQFKELFFAAPRLPLERDPYAKNSDYTLGGGRGSDNYLCSAAYGSKDCMYCYDARHSANLVDCNFMANSELCYGSVSSQRCYGSLFLLECVECMDSGFLFGCKNCSNCFLSSNLRNKQYVFGNEELSKAEYEKKRRAVDLGDRETLAEHKRKFNEMCRGAVRRALQTKNAPGCVGDSLTDCKNCYLVFRSNRCENVRYADNIETTGNSTDIVNGASADNSYEAVIVLGSYIKFSMCVRYCTNLEYSSNCYNCHYCFGSVGLRGKQFHILNKPYDETTYWNAVDRIKTKMLAAGEYGEFFPLSLGLIPYQSTNAQKDFPLTPEEAAEMGIAWYVEPESQMPPNKKVRCAPQDIPQNIQDVPDDIVSDTIISETSKRPFNITKQEVDFHRKFGLALPTENYWQRMLERISLERGVRLYPFTCPKCNEKSFAVYDPQKQKQFTILCEKCYIRQFA